MNLNMNMYVNVNMFIYILMCILNIQFCPFTAHIQVNVQFILYSASLHEHAPLFMYCTLTVHVSEMYVHDSNYINNIVSKKVDVKRVKNIATFLRLEIYGKLTLTH